MQPCRRRRLLLAIYLDLLLFVSAAALASWLLRGGLGIDVGLGAIMLGFAVVELLALRWGRVSPGCWALGIVHADGTRVVLPAWPARETWWTLLIGALGVLSGAKEVTRWTQGLPPPPFMGLSLSWDQAAAVVTTNGLLSMAAAIGVLRTRARAALLGALLSAIASASWLLSWHQIPTWVAARTIARRAVQGLPVREGEIARMQWILPGGALVAGIVGGVWLLCAWRRFHAKDRAAAAASEPSSEANR